MRSKPIRINPIRLAQVLEGRVISPFYWLAPNMAWNLLRRAWANLPINESLEQKYPYIAEFIEDQERVDTQVVEKLFGILLDNEVFHNPEPESKSRNGSTIRDYLNSEIFVNWYRMGEDGRIIQAPADQEAWWPQVRVEINNSHTMSPSFQNSNGNGVTQAQASWSSNISQSGNFNILFADKQDDIDGTIDALLWNETISEPEKAKLAKVKSELSEAKTEDEKQSVIVRLWGIVKNTLKDTKDYLQLAQLLLHFDKVIPPETINAISAIMASYRT